GVGQEHRAGAGLEEAGVDVGLGEADIVLHAGVDLQVHGRGAVGNVEGEGVGRHAEVEFLDQGGLAGGQGGDAAGDGHQGVVGDEVAAGDVAALQGDLVEGVAGAVEVEQAVLVDGQVGAGGVGGDVVGADELIG